MLIEQVLPEVISEKSTLRDRLFEIAMTRSLSKEQANAILSIVPKRLIGAGSFLDKMTGLWRYEFGVPYDIADDLLWGTHMWIPVECLFTAIFCAYTRLTENKRTLYLERLADQYAHQAVLIEMIPGSRVDTDVPLEFEVAGMGSGNSTIDWLIGPEGGRIVLVDVKRRTIDFIKQAERITAEGAVPEPDHNPALLFRSVEKKFITANPDKQLQGAWIFTDIMQDEEQLAQGFEALDQSKVHFAIFGDWKSDVFVLVKRDSDQQYLLDLFNSKPSSRFTFTIDD
jgi:hypothetical protein